MQNEIWIGTRKAYVIPASDDVVEVLIDCSVTGGMIRLPMAYSQFLRWQKPRAERELIQNIFPEMKPEMREVLISGKTPAEWNHIFGKKQFTKAKLEKEFNYEFES